MPAPVEVSDFQAECDRVDAASAALMAQIFGSGLPISPEIITAIGQLPQTAVSAVVTSNSKWIGGTPPPRFDDFCQMLDGMPLFPHQLKILQDTNLLSPDGLVSGERSLHELVLIWGKGCLSGDSSLRDAVTGETMTVAQWAERGTPLTVQTITPCGWVCNTRASSVELKGFSSLFRVTLADGRAFDATGFHRVMTPDGWRQVDELIPRTSCIRALDAGKCSGFIGEDCSGFVGVVRVEDVGRGHYYDLTVPATGCYFDADGVLHHNSGKDYLASKFGAWIALVLNSLVSDPAAYFGIAPHSRLSVINVAPSEDVARRIYFGYFKRWLDHSIFDPFLPDKREKQVHADYVEFFRVAPETGRPYLSVGVYSMHSRATSLEGHNIIFWVMDESDDFLDSADKSNAQIIYRILRTSASTRFAKYWIGINISYPRTEGGFVLRLRDRALANIKDMGEGKSIYFVDLAPTWEVNLRFDRNDPVVVEDYKNDPAAANAMYACIPMATESAFFDFPERIDAAVDHIRPPVAVVTSNNLELPIRTGGMNYYVTGVIDETSIRRIPGCSYVLGGDGGAKKDAYTLAVWHCDTSSEAVDWLCPRCGDIPEMRDGAEYERQPHGTRHDIKENILCGVCVSKPADFTGGYASGTVLMTGWWKRLSRKDMQIFDSSGKPYNVSPLFEDLIVQIKPQRATNSDPNSEQGKNRPVYFPGMQDLCRQLIERVGIVAARFDPWQTIEVTQGLIASTGGDISEISFSNTDQFKRARFAKSMLHADLLSFLPHPERDREWKRLQRIGDNKVDHPKGPGEGKDIFDAESIAIWTAATTRNSRLALDWI